MGDDAGDDEDSSPTWKREVAEKWAQLDAEEEEEEAAAAKTVEGNVELETATATKTAIEGAVESEIQALGDGALLAKDLRRQGAALPHAGYETIAAVAIFRIDSPATNAACSSADGEKCDGKGVSGDGGS